MRLINMTAATLADYTIAQLNNFFPDGRNEVGARIRQNLPDALARLNTCINAIRFWTQDEFHYLHSTQYSLYLYFLSNTIWRATGDTEAATKLFLLNKALNGIDCFYEIELPDVFFIGHTPGIVLAKATYGSHLVLYQNSTVGKNHGVAPVIEEGVVMYPNTAIIGRSHVKRGTVLSQGTSIINQDTPGDCLVFPGVDGELVFKQCKRDILDDIFRN